MDFNNYGNEYGGNGPDYQGGNNSPYGHPYSPPYRIPGKSLATAALVLGIISILSTLLMTIYIPIVLGSIAIVLAILSKGSQKNLPGQATAGIVCGVGGLVMNLGIFAASLAFVLSHPEMLRDAARIYDTQFEQIYGESTEDMLGQSFEDMIDEVFGLE